MYNAKLKLGGMAALLLAAILLGAPGRLAPALAQQSGQRWDIFLLSLHPHTICRGYHDFFVVQVTDSALRPVPNATVILEAEASHDVRNTDSAGVAAVHYDAPNVGGTDTIRISAGKAGSEMGFITFDMDVEWCLLKTIFGYSGSYTDPEGALHFQETGSMAEAQLEPDADGQRYTGTTETHVVVNVSLDQPGITCTWDPPYEVTYDTTITADVDEEGNLLNVDFSFEPITPMLSVVITCSGGGVTLSSVEVPYHETGLAPLGLENLTFAGTGGTINNAVSEGLALQSGSGAVRLTLLPEQQATASLPGDPIASLWRLFPWPFALEGG